MKKLYFLSFLLISPIALSANEMKHDHEMNGHSMEEHEMHAKEMDHSMHHSMHHGSHQSPIGIMGKQVHQKGHFMLSFRQMKMSMKGNTNDGQSLTDSEIIDLPNPYSMMNMPPKLSVVPQEMDMDMTMIGGMYGLTDSHTLMVMAMYVEKSMSLSTYSPMMQRDFIGDFNTKTSGLANVSISSLIKLKETNDYQLNAQIGLEKSVGDNDKTGKVLTPMNMTKEMILPYSMQNGDESTSLMIGLNVCKNIEDWSIGGQMMVKSVINQKDWNYGESMLLSGWVGRNLNDMLYTSLRLTYRDVDKIDGRDMRIMAPVQTANPDNYGGSRYEVSLGLNKTLKNGDSLGLELSIPFQQKLNGPQMEEDLTLTFGYKKGF